MTTTIVSNRTYCQLLVAREMLDDCFRRPVLLQDAASTIDLSPWHFQREFCRAFGESPHEYVTRLRLAKARELLTTSQLSIMEICLDVGFTSLGSFSTLFKNHVGTSPGKYRRQTRTLVSVNGFRDWVFVPFCFANAFAPANCRMP